MNEEWIERGKKVIMNTYSQFPISIEKGEGINLWDADGKKYIDFVAGIAVNSLGYNDRDYVEEIFKQVTKIQHVSNLYWIPPSIELAEILVKNSCFDKVFFCNSGAESIEGAIKLARKYGLEKHGKHCNEIITMKQSFHGRTLMALTATGQTKYQKGFDPLVPGFSYANFNDFEDLRNKVNEKTCGILIEPIQGEGGIIPADSYFLHEVRNMCDEMDIVLIFDEVQCGMGRTGNLFAYELFGVEPDVACFAKGLGGGIPIGAILANHKKADALKPGEHASTFGGNYIACVAAKVVLDKLLNHGVLDNVKKQGKILKEKLNELKEKYDFVIDARGYGLIQGLEVRFTNKDVKIKDIVLKCIEKGLLLVGAGENTIRFVPPLIIKEQEIVEGIEILDGVLKQI